MPSLANSVNTCHSGELAAMTSSGVMRSSRSPMGRITSAAKRCTPSSRSCSSLAKGSSAPVICSVPCGSSSHRAIRVPSAGRAMLAN